MENFNLSVQKVVAVSYERWSPTEGSNYSDLTEKILLLYFGRVVAGGIWTPLRGRGLYREVKLYINMLFTWSYKSARSG